MRPELEDIRKVVQFILPGADLTGALVFPVVFVNCQTDSHKYTKPTTTVLPSAPYLR